MIARRSLMLTFAILIAWTATCLLAVIIVPMDEIVIGLSDGSIWFERNSNGDTSSEVFVCAAPSLPALWYSHESGSGWNNWSFPLWPIALAGAVFASIAFKRQPSHGVTLHRSGNRLLSPSAFPPSPRRAGRSP